MHFLLRICIYYGVYIYILVYAQSKHRGISITAIVINLYICHYQNVKTFLVPTLFVHTHRHTRTNSIL